MPKFTTFKSVNRIGDSSKITNHMDKIIAYVDQYGIDFKNTILPLEAQQVAEFAEGYGFYLTCIKEFDNE